MGPRTADLSELDRGGHVVRPIAKEKAMKRKLQKLSLTKETLRSLEDPSLNRVAGGATTLPDTCPVFVCNGTDATRRCSVCCGP
jgi:hypothetical protein